MALHNLSQQMYVAIAFAPAALTNGTQNGSSVDTNQTANAGGPFRRACAIVQLNTGTGTTGNFQVQDSPDGTTWTSVSGATLGSAQAASTSGVYLVDIDLAKRQRYLRIQIIGSGGTPAGSGSAELVLFEGETLAPQQSQTPILV